MKKLPNLTPNQLAALAIVVLFLAWIGMMAFDALKN